VLVARSLAPSVRFNYGDERQGCTDRAEPQAKVEVDCGRDVFNGLLVRYKVDMRFVEIVLVTLTARAVSGAPAYGHRVLCLLRDWRRYRAGD
jgi:hypothetical protein